MSTAIDPRRVLGMAFSMSLLSVGSHGVSRLAGKLITQLEPKLDFTQSALWGATYGATAEIMLKTFPSARFHQRARSFVAAAVVPSCIFRKAGETPAEILNSFAPLAALFIVYRAWHARKHGFPIF